MLFTCCKSVAPPMVVFVWLTGCLLGQSDLAKLMELIDQDKRSPAFNEIKQLREQNSRNPQSPLFEFGYGLSAVKNGRTKEAIEVLQPFVDQRPKVFQARLLLMRAYIDLEQFDSVVIQAEKLLLNYPSQKDSAQHVAKVVGTLVGFLNFARTDCSDELKKRLEEAAETRIPAEFTNEYRDSISLVESRVATINDEIKIALEKAELETESKVASNLRDAEKLRHEADSQAEELQKREQSRTEKFEAMKLSVQTIMQEGATLTADILHLNTQIDNWQRQRRSLEKEEVEKDKYGNRTTRTVITDRRQYNQLGTMIANSRADKSLKENRRRVLLENLQQLQVQAVGLLSQQQLDELFSKNKMRQFGKAADTRERKAERESDRKGKGVPALRALNLKLKNYSTYEPLDVASNKEFLQEIAKKFIGSR